MSGETHVTACMGVRVCERDRIIVNERTYA